MTYISVYVLLSMACHRILDDDDVDDDDDDSKTFLTWGRSLM